MILPGSRGVDASLKLAAECGGGWSWRIILRATDAANLRMEMHNVIPADQATPEISAGPYPVMIMEVRRA
jgi:hypothetical protein